MFEFNLATALWAMVFALCLGSIFVTIARKICKKMVRNENSAILRKMTMTLNDVVSEPKTPQTALAIDLEKGIPNVKMGFSDDSVSLDESILKM